MVHVLLVVHDVVQALRERRALRGAGLAVEVVHRGVEALRWSATEPVDVLVMEQRLPDMSYRDLLRGVRHARPAVPTIVLLPSHEAHRRVEVLKLGATDTLCADPGPLFPLALARVVIDVYTRARLAARMRESYSRVFAYPVPDGWFCTRPNGQVLACQGTDTTDVLPLATSRAWGQNVARLVPPEVGAQWLQAIRTAHRTGAPQGFQYRAASNRGRWHYEARVVRTGRPGEVYTFVKRSIDPRWVDAERARHILGCDPPRARPTMRPPPAPMAAPAPRAPRRRRAAAAALIAHAGVA